MSNYFNLNNQPWVWGTRIDKTFLPLIAKESLILKTPTKPKEEVLKAVLSLGE